MNRQIKFRSWNNDRMLYSHNNTINKSNVQNSWFFNTVNEDNIIMQYTGYKDKNGVEIYEGDILQCTYSNDIAKFFKIKTFTSVVLFAGGSFRVTEVGYNDMNYIFDFPMTLEECYNDNDIVIGNMYETPELHNND